MNSVVQLAKQFYDNPTGVVAKAIFDNDTMRMFYCYARLYGFAVETLNQVEYISETKLIEQVAERYYNEDFSSQLEEPVQNAYSASLMGKFKYFEVIKMMMTNVHTHFGALNNFESCLAITTGFFKIYAREATDKGIDNWMKLSNEQFSKITEKDILAGLESSH